MEILKAIFYFQLVRSPKVEHQSGMVRMVVVSALSLLLVYGLTNMGISSVFAEHPEAMNMSAPVPPGQHPISVTSLREAPGNQPVKNISLVTEPAMIDGRTLWTYNGTIPGPAIRIKQGDRLRVTLTNRLPVSTTIHWHGIRLPNAEDGVAGITQDAVKPGDTYTYGFVAKDAGTFMYHSHQDTFAQMLKGLYGALIVEPANPLVVEHDYPIVLHESPGDNYIGPGMNGYLRLGIKQVPAFNGQTSDLSLEAKPGEKVRLRLIGAIQGKADGFPNYMIAAPREVVLLGTPYQVVAIDGSNLNEPQLIGPRRIPLGTGQRYDLVFTMPASGQVRLVDTRGPNTVTMGRGAAPQAGLLHHSDRGSQYASRDYRRLLAQRHISRTAKCYDSAMKERFVATLKVECAIQPFASRAAARLAIFDFIEVWYNRQRVHSSLGYRSPANFEAQFAKPLH